MGSGMGFATWVGLGSGHRVGTGLQMELELIEAWGLRWGWVLVWHPGVKQLRALRMRMGRAGP